MCDTVETLVEVRPDEAGRTWLVAPASVSHTEEAGRWSVLGMRQWLLAPARGLSEQRIEDKGMGVVISAEDTQGPYEWLMVGWGAFPYRHWWP